MTKKRTPEQTPLMSQYQQIKNKYPDAILLFRVGDFYETFGEDAIKTAQALGIVLTKRGPGSPSEIELAGFPYHSLDSYLPKLVRAGHRVAVCEQLEDPKVAKKIVKRGVTELVTPGVTINDKLLEQQMNNFLCAVHCNGASYGIAFIDVSTGEFFATEGQYEYIDKLLQSFAPTEVLISKQHKSNFEQQFTSKLYKYYLEDWLFEYNYAYEVLLKQFQTPSLKGFGMEELKLATVAAGVCMHYINDTQQQASQGQIVQLSRIDEHNYVWLDRFTIRNLELFQPLQEGGTSLFQAINKTQTPMGSRLLKRWLALPLKDSTSINERLNFIEFLLQEHTLHQELKQHIPGITDLERLTTKISLSKISPRECLTLARSLEHIFKIKTLLQPIEHPVVQKIAQQLDPCEALSQQILTTLIPEAPAVAQKGNFIADGVHPQLDELRHLVQNSKSILEDLVKKEAEATGISSLKIGFNNVFGYYLEVTNTHKDKAPERWQRKQTLANAERYITEELKVYEERILGAEEQILALELSVYSELLLKASAYTSQLQKNAQLIARVDVLAGLTTLAKTYNYCKPELNTSLDLSIKEGRHPVIEQLLPVDSPYIPNDLHFNQEQQIMMITGPNMSGKSALLRQTALIVILAQMGSFVPAKSATLGLIDKVFTRVGASDNLSQGESTFMVEMTETASIMNNLSSRSLVILDEIGRGTSTYDGISIAWAIAHYIHEHPQHKAKTLFATHYHELNEMEQQLERIKNYHISVKEINHKILFLRTLAKGGSEHSFGIHVAQLAGMPQSILDKANAILKDLEATRQQQDTPLRESLKQQKQNQALQFNIFEVGQEDCLELKSKLSALDVNTLTPIEALFQLNELKKMIQ